jgi:hypothetical protein
MGLALTGNGKGAEAETALREAIEMQESTVPLGAWERDQATSALGAAIAAQGRFAEAEPLLVQSYERLLANPRAPAMRTREAHERVVDLYRRWSERESTPERTETLATWRASAPGSAPRISLK